MLALENVSWTAADGEEILRNISLEVPDGKMTVITGPNGGGKTSLAKLIAGLINPTEGKILLDGTDITGWDMTERARHGISYAFQQPVRFKGLTVRDLLETSAEKKLDSAEVCGYLGEVGLCAEEYIDRVVDDSLSGGEGKRIEIATVLARKNVKLRVFDEPEAGIDLWSFTILEIADRIVVVDDGKIRIAGDRQEVLPRLLAQEKAARCPKEEERSCAK